MFFIPRGSKIRCCENFTEGIPLVRHNFRQESVVGAAIEESLTGIEIQRPLPFDQINQRSLRNDILFPSAGQFQEAPLAAQPAGVM